MDTLKQDELFFLEQHREAYSLHEALEEELIRRFPETRIRVQKTQITFSNRHVYACVSIRPRRSADRAVSRPLDDAFCSEQPVRA